MKESQEKREIKQVKYKTFLSIITGAISGFINGLFGGGGGMIVVPMLTKFLKYHSKNFNTNIVFIKVYNNHWLRILFFL